MNEQAPQPEKKYGEMVPEYVFDKTWQEASFIVPPNNEIRKELRRKLEDFTHYGVMHLSENKSAKEILLARVAMIEAYDAKMPSDIQEVSNQLESRRERISALTAELIDSNEVFPFSGIDPEVYTRLKADIERDQNRSEYDISSSSLDELIKRFRDEGMRITLGDHPAVGNIYIVPAGRVYNQPDRLPRLSNIMMQDDSLPPKHLHASVIKDKLEELSRLLVQVRSFAVRS